MKLDDALAPYKRQESLASLVCLVDDLDAQNVLVLWPNVPLEWILPSGKAPADANARWRWLWEGVCYDEEQFAAMADMPLKTLERKLTKLAAARLIFPDGTVRSTALQIVNSRIKKELKR